MSEFDVILGMDWLTAYRVVIDCEHSRLHAGWYSCCVSRGQASYFAPDNIQVQVSGTVRELASEPYPKGRGETRLRSTSSSLRVCGCFSG